MKNPLSEELTQRQRSFHRYAPPIVQEVLHSPGQPLDAVARAAMESRFGYDFSDVRVHSDPKGGASAQAVEALAYTVGRDIVFGAGQYAPNTVKGQKLIAHELVHTMQQPAAPKADPHDIPLFDETPRGQAAEMEAEDRSVNAMSAPHRRVQAVPTQSPVLQRQSAGGRVRSPVAEEAVTQLSDVVAASVGRPLSRDERNLAHSVYAQSIDYAGVRLVPVDALQFRTVGNNIYIPRNFTIADPEMAETLIHELAHVWQYQHGGTSYISISLGTQIVAGLRHGNRNYAYDYQINPGQSFFDFTPEQQGFLVQNYFAMQRDRSMIARDLASGRSRTYESNHLGSNGFNALLSATDRQNEINRELPLHEPLIQQMQAALPRPELNILLLRASEVMITPGQNQIPVPPERQLTPIKPLVQVHF